MSLAPAAAATSPSVPQSDATKVGGAALTSLSSNFNNFLRMLMTQLQNQDPTSPMDTNEFTRELVQFSAVEQQITTNTSLTRLIELTQAGEVMQSAAMIGRHVAVESDTMPLQGGKSTLRFTAPAEQPVHITVLNEKGNTIVEHAVTAKRGPNDFTWDGRDTAGKTVPDGAYRVAVQAIGVDGKPKALPFQVVGVASGVVTENQGVRLQLGSVSVPFAKVRSVME